MILNLQFLLYFIGNFQIFHFHLFFCSIYCIASFTPPLVQVFLVEANLYIERGGGIVERDDSVKILTLTIKNPFLLNLYACVLLLFS